MQVSIHVLDNGLTVYLSENHAEPRIAARIAVRAGSAQDPRDATGMAHYLEHLLANKGSQQLGTVDYEAERAHLDRIRALYDQLFALTDPDERAAVYAQIDTESQQANDYWRQNELKKAYGVLGARGLNAYTSNDRTVYVVDIPANKLEPWAVLEGDRFSNPVFRAFQTEVETVFEEFNRAQDSSGRLLSRTMGEALFGDHPYGTSTLGLAEHLKNPSVSKTEAYFDTWYVPGNMAVILSGDFESERALELIETHLGTLPAAPVPPRDARVPEPLDGVSRVEVEHRGEPTVQLGWLTVPVSHDDAMALRLADMMMNNAATGLLDTRLNQPQVVRRSGSFPRFGNEGGRWIVWGTPRDGQTVEEVEQLLLEQVAALKAGDFSQSDLDAVVRNYEVDDKRELERNDRRVSKMLDAFITGEDWDRAWRFSQRAKQVTRADVVRVANQYFAGDFAVVVRRDGTPDLAKMEAPALTDLEVDKPDNSPFFEQVVAMDTPPLEVQSLQQGVDYEVRDTAAGPLYTTANPYNDLYQLTLRFWTGAEHDRALCPALGVWNKAGVGDLDLAGFERAMYELAAGVRVQCGRRNVDVHLTGPAETLPEVLPLVLERLRAPALTDEVVAQYLADRVAARAQQKVQQSRQDSILQSYARQGDDSWYLSMELPDDALLALTRDALASKPGGLLSLQRSAFYAGPHTAEQVAAWLPTEGTFEAPPELAPYRLVTPDTSRLLFLDYPDAAQARVSVLVPHELRDGDHAPEYRLYNEYMGGSAGLVFQEIREARGLAYSARGGYSTGSRLGDQNYAYGRAACQADKTVQTVELLLPMTQQMPATPSRWNRVQRAAMQKLRADRVEFRSLGSVVERWKLRGYDGDPRARELDAMGQRTLDDIAAFAHTWQDTPVTVTVVGDRSRIDLDALGALLPVTEVQLSDLAVY